MKKLIEQKIPKLLFQQSLPAVIGMFVMTMYNVVDTIFIGKGVGTLGLAGVAICFPLIMSVGAVSQMIGVGFSSIISRNIGAHDYKIAEKAFGNFITMSFLVGVIMTILGVIFFIPLLKILGASSSVFPFARDYISIIIIGIIFFVFFAGGNNIIRSTGNAKKAMQAMMVSAFLNIILDYIFIFELDLGIKGAALATVISWIVGVLYVLKVLFVKNNHLKIGLNHLKLDFKIVKKSLAIGFSSFSRQISSSIITVFVNKSLSIYSNDLAIAAFGIIMRILMLILMPIFGIVQGLMPIIGANYGAGEFKRTRSATLLAMRVSTVISILAFIVIMLIPEYLFSFFTSDQLLIQSSSKFLRIIAIGLPLIGFQMIVGGFYQALGKIRQALFISLLRQIILFIPLILILPSIFGVNGIYFAFPIADVLAAIITFYVFKKSYQALKEL